MRRPRSAATFALGDQVYAYVVSGLSVASDLALPGLIEASTPEAAADVVIRAGAVPERLDDPEARGPNWQLAGDRFLMAIPRVVRMLLTGGRELVYAAGEGVAAEEMAIFVSGTGFGILLHQRGRVVLHASAVRVGAGAALFCGPSGAGKSTLAAALVNRGHDLLADDFCGIDSGPHGLRVYPDGRQLKLWRNAIHRLSLDAHQLAPVRTQIQKYYVEPRASTVSALPILAVYILREARPPFVAGIERPNIVDGALMVRANAYRPALVRRMEQADVYFTAAATLSRAGVFTLTRPMSFDHLPGVLDWLSAHWRSLGLEAAA